MRTIGTRSRAFVLMRLRVLTSDRTITHARHVVEPSTLASASRKGVTSLSQALSERHGATRPTATQRAPIACERSSSTRHYPSWRTHHRDGARRCVRTTPTLPVSTRGGELSTRSATDAPSRQRVGHAAL